MRDFRGDTQAVRTSAVCVLVLLSRSSIYASVHTPVNEHSWFQGMGQMHNAEPQPHKKTLVSCGLFCMEFMTLYSYDLFCVLCYAFFPWAHWESMSCVGGHIPSQKNGF